MCLPHPPDGADTLKFNLHIIGRAKKGCEFNQERCELKKFLYFMLHDGDEIHLVFFWLEVDHHNSTHAILIMAVQIHHFNPLK